MRGYDRLFQIVGPSASPARSFVSSSASDGASIVSSSGSDRTYSVSSLGSDGVPCASSTRSDGASCISSARSDGASYISSLRSNSTSCIFVCFLAMPAAAPAPALVLRAAGHLFSRLIHLHPVSRRGPHRQHHCCRSCQAHQSTALPAVSLSSASAPGRAPTDPSS